MFKIISTFEIDHKQQQMEFIILIIITSLFINGLHWATYYELHRVDAGKDYFRMERNPDESNVLWFLRYYPEKHFPTWIYKPLIGCVQCMASVWGSIFYWAHYASEWSIDPFWSHPWFVINTNISFILTWGVFVMCVSAMNMVVNKQIES